MGIRDRKNKLITVLKVRALGGKLTPEQVARFELRYRQAVNEQEQDAVTADIAKALDGWKTGTDAFSRILRNASDFGEPDFGEPNEDDDPPALKEALARSQITFVRK